MQPTPTAGFAVLEVMVAAAVLVIGVLGMLSSVVSGTRLVNANRETSLAHQAARAKCEEIQDVTFAQVFATFNTDKADDPGGAGTAPGANFSVAGLTPALNDADGFVGQIQFPTVPNGAGVALCEKVVDAGMGMPRDLNGDGLVSAGAMPGTYLLLPVRIRVSWRGSAGTRSLTFEDLMIAR